MMQRYREWRKGHWHYDNDLSLSSECLREGLKVVQDRIPLGETIKWFWGQWCSRLRGYIEQDRIWLVAFGMWISQTGHRSLKSFADEYRRGPNPYA